MRALSVRAETKDISELYIAWSIMPQTNNKVRNYLLHVMTFILNDISTPTFDFVTPIYHQSDSESDLFKYIPEVNLLSAHP